MVLKSGNLFPPTSDKIPFVLLCRPLPYNPHTSLPTRPPKPSLFNLPPPSSLSTRLSIPVTHGFAELETPFGY